jgi:membrane associated rhomboid family serine protease
LAGSIQRVLPVAYLLSTQDLFSGAGGIAASIAIAGFLGQALAVARSSPDEQRRRLTAVLGVAGLGVMIGLILLSAIGR